MARYPLLPEQTPLPVASSRPLSPPASVWSAAALYSGRLPSPQPDTHQIKDPQVDKVTESYARPIFLCTFSR